MLEMQKSTKLYGRDTIIGNETEVTVDCGAYAYTVRRDYAGMWCHAMLSRPIRNLRDAVEAIRRADARQAA